MVVLGVLFGYEVVQPVTRYFAQDRCYNGCEVEEALILGG